MLEKPGHSLTLLFSLICTLWHTLWFNYIPFYFRHPLTHTLSIRTLTYFTTNPCPTPSHRIPPYPIPTLSYSHSILLYPVLFYPILFHQQCVHSSYGDNPSHHHHHQTHSHPILLYPILSYLILLPPYLIVSYLILSYSHPVLFYSIPPAMRTLFLWR